MYKIETEKEFEEFKNSKSVVKYAVILPSALVNKKNLKELEETKIKNLLNLILNN
jgi:hypothetical protein